jgi:hypothetical protein
LNPRGSLKNALRTSFITSINPASLLFLQVIYDIVLGARLKDAVSNQRQKSRSSDLPFV